MAHEFGRLTSFGPECRWMVFIFSREDGYYVEWRHAHVGGLFSDCPGDTFGPLTHGEMADVVDALTDEIQVKAREVRIT